MRDFGPQNRGRVPPAPFSATDVVGVGSLSAALKKFVFRSPELEQLRINAKTFAEERKLPFYADADMVNPCYGSEEAVLPLRYFKDEDWDAGLILPLPDDLADEPEDPEIEKLFEREVNLITEFYGEINLRADTLFGFLKRKELAGWGTTTHGQLVPIAHTIWCHPDFYVHPPTGDIYDGNAFPMIRRWSGVVFSLPGELPHAQPSLSIQRDAGAAVQLNNPPVLVSDQKLASSPNPNDSPYQQCLRWLVRLMQAEPDKPITNKALWNEAQELWPTLGQVKFKQAKANAVETTRAVKWSKSGRPQNNRLA